MKLLKLTKEQKLKAYKAVLRALNNSELNTSIDMDGRKYFYRDPITGISGYGVCGLLQHYLKIKFNHLSYNLFVTSIFNEMEPYKLKYDKGNLMYWLKDTSTRIKVVEEIISDLSLTEDEESVKEFIEILQENLEDGTFKELPKSFNDSIIKVCMETIKLNLRDHLTKRI